MSKTLTEIAQQLKGATHNRKARSARTIDIKVQLIYAFNGIGKTRLSREFKELIAPKSENGGDADDSRAKILYYNAFTEDLFYWDNDLEWDADRKLKIQPNSYTEWVLQEQGHDQNVITHFQHYTSNRLTPRFNQEYTTKDKGGQNITVPAFSEVTFSFERGNEEPAEHIKVSKGEESCFIWSIFYSLIEQVVDVLNTPELEDRDTDQFDQLEYVFIDDPVSSLDENHLIELAVDVGQLIKSSKSELKFIITTHSPLFYNVLHNELRKDKYKTYVLKKHEDGEYELKPQSSDSPFSYHLHLKSEIEKAIGAGQIHKYHFNFLRNILEKTSTFLGYQNWGDLLDLVEGDRKSYETRLINISSHSKHTGEEVAELTDDDKRVLDFLVKQIHNIYNFYPRPL
ncbi:MAG: AAA family ATPase [Desulfobacterium sp.]|nr:AAA family ATPase [Desulfobacterium sp.]